MKNYRLNILYFFRMKLSGSERNASGNNNASFISKYFHKNSFNLKFNYDCIMTELYMKIFII